MGFGFAYVLVMQIPHEFAQAIASVSIELGKSQRRLPNNIGITGKVHSTSFLISGLIKQTNKQKIVTLFLPYITSSPHFTRFINWNHMSHRSVVIFVD